MKARMHFDSLTYANKLKAAGMEPKLAEVQALALVEAIEEGIATKSDIHELKGEIHDLKVEVKASLTLANSETDAKLKDLKYELSRQMNGLFMANITIVGIFIAISQFIARLH